MFCIVRTRPLWIRLAVSGRVQGILYHNPALSDSSNENVKKEKEFSVFQNSETTQSLAASDLDLTG